MIQHINNNSKCFWLDSEPTKLFAGGMFNNPTILLYIKDKKQAHYLQMRLLFVRQSTTGCFPVVPFPQKPKDHQGLPDSNFQRNHTGVAGRPSTDQGRTHRQIPGLPTSTGNTLIMHLGMTGWLDYGKDEKPKYTRATFIFDSGNSLYFVNPRKLGRLHITDNIHAFIQQMEIGPDALAIREDDFLRKMKKKKGLLK